MRKLYDWKAWFEKVPGIDGKVRFVLIRGNHYRCSTSSMIAQLRIAAVHCDVSLSIVDLEDRLSVVVTKREPTCV